VVVFRAYLAQFWGSYFGGVPPFKMSGIGHLWFLGLRWTLSNRFQVVNFTADLAEFWGRSFWASGRGLPPIKMSGWSLFLGLCWTYCNKF